MEKGTPVTPETIYSHHDTHPLVLYLDLTKTWKSDWLTWEPETIRLLLPKKKKQSVSRLAHAKIQALRTARTVPDLVQNQWEIFLPVITALNNVEPDFRTLQPPSAARVAAGVDILQTLWGTDSSVWGREVKRFIAVALLHEEMYVAPPVLSFVQLYLRGMEYECPVCGNREKVLEDTDGKCDSCGKNWYARASGKLVRSHDVIFHMKYDERPVLDRMHRAIADSASFHPLDDDPHDVQVVRVLAAHAYMESRQRQFLTQCMDLNLDSEKVHG